MIYAVGVGPGDPELLTRKVERLLRSVPVVCAPTAGPIDSCYALSIVEPLLDRTRQKVIIQVFPMLKNQDGLDEYWETAAAEVAARVRGGKRCSLHNHRRPVHLLHLYLSLSHHPRKVPGYPNNGV